MGLLYVVVVVVLAGSFSKEIAAASIESSAKPWNLTISDGTVRELPEDDSEDQTTFPQQITDVEVTETPTNPSNIQISARQANVVDNFTCIEPGVFSDCRTYYSKTNLTDKKWKKHKCANFNYFDITSTTCVNLQPKWCAKITKNKTGGLVEPPVGVFFKSDCKAFVRCTDTPNVPKLNQYECPGTTFYDREKKLCTKPTTECLLD